MITIEGENFIGESTGDVFEAGIHTSTWPRDIDGLNINPGKQKKISLGSTIGVAIELADIIPMKFDARVAKFVVAKSVVIVGQNQLAKVELVLDLAASEGEDGTDISHKLMIDRRWKFVPLPVPDSIIRGLVEPRAMSFADAHCENADNHIADNTKPSTKNGKKPAVVA